MVGWPVLAFFPPVLYLRLVLCMMDRARVRHFAKTGGARERRREQDVVEEELLVRHYLNAVIELRRESTGARHIVLGVFEARFRVENRSGKDVRDVMRQIVLFKEVHAGTVVEVAHDN